MIYILRSKRGQGVVCCSEHPSYKEAMERARVILQGNARSSFTTLELVSIDTLTGQASIRDLLTYMSKDLEEFIKPASQMGDNLRVLVMTADGCLHNIRSAARNGNALVLETG